MDPEAYSRLIARPLSAGVETVPLTAAIGRILARDIVADVPLPAYPTSAMDGYAFGPEALSRAQSGQRVPVRGDVPAGHPPVALPVGAAVRVMTGAEVPAGAEAVVPVEYTDAERTGPVPEAITVGGLPAAIRGGWNIRGIGEDTRLGDIIAIGGEPLSAAGIGTLAMLGLTRIEVVRPLHVGLIVTGDELESPTHAGDGPRIPNSNLPMLVAALGAVGVIAHPRTSTDDPVAFSGILDELLPDVDLVITTGGISAGAFEVVRAALDGVSSRFLRVSQRPGGPQGFGKRGGVPLLHFPGTPTGAFLSFHLFAVPLLGGTLLEHRWRRAVYAGPVLHGHGRGASLVPVSYADDGHVVPAARARLRDFAGADAILRVPAAPGGIADGDVVDVVPCGPGEVGPVGAGPA